MSFEPRPAPESGSANAGDYGLLTPVVAGSTVAVLTGDAAVVGAILHVEAAWVAVLEEAGLASAGSAALVRQAADPARYDVAGLAVRAQGGGNPVIPVLADLRAEMKRLAGSAAAAAAHKTAVHKTLTSQDVMDSALMLVARDAVAALLADVRTSTAALAALSVERSDTLQVARTLTQHSLPSTFGLKAAQWFRGLAAAASRLEALDFPVQYGGAAGTLAAATVLTDGSAADPFVLADRLADELGLSREATPWHTNRLAVTTLGDSLTGFTDACGKIANDVLLLSRPELGELAEPRKAGRGVSSAMPQKQNPVLAVLIRSAALSAPALAAQLHVAAATADDERPDGAWHTEWQALRNLLRLAGGAATQLRQLAVGLQVFPDAMRSNLELSGPLLLSEAVTAAVAPLLEEEPTARTPGPTGSRGPGGKERLQALMEQSLRAPKAEQGAVYARLLRETVPAEKLPDAQLASLLDPANYLGQSRTIAARILSAYPEWATFEAAGPADSTPNNMPGGAADNNGGPGGSARSSTGAAAVPPAGAGARGRLK